MIQRHIVYIHPPVYIILWRGQKH